MTAPKPYPLSWPPGWPRTAKRDKAPYRTALPAALSNLKRELHALCGQRAAATLMLSSNHALGQENPTDPGVVAYFTWMDELMAIPNDRWPRVEHNVQAIALTLEAMRAMDRHGAKHMIRAMLRGFTALPAPADPEDWRTVLGCREDPGSDRSAQLREAEARYQYEARKHHPDKPGGSHERMQQLNDAITQARKELSP